ncbi:group 1 truncated hemoglobin, partial [Xanthomonas perforans]|nr:group 1 truncated hemoglobin [Xanthomonas perforans]
VLSNQQAHVLVAVRVGDFSALVEDLNWAMDQRKIPRRTQNRLLARLAAMHGEIVNH